MRVHSFIRNVICWWHKTSLIFLLLRLCVDSFRNLFFVYFENTLLRWVRVTCFTRSNSSGYWSLYQIIYWIQLQYIMRIHRRRRQDHFCINRILLFFPLFLQPLCRRRLSFVSIYFHWLVPVLCVNINHLVHASRQNTPNGGKWAATENWAAKRETKNCTRNQHTKCCSVFSARWIFRTMLDASLRARATRSVSISKGSMFAQSYTHTNQQFLFCARAFLRSFASALFQKI